MFGYQNRRLISNVPTFSLLLALLFMEIIFTLQIYGMLKIKPEIAGAIYIAIIGWALAINQIFLQIRATQRHQLEIEAINQIQMAMNQLAESGAMLVTLNNKFVVMPINPHSNFWLNKAHEKFDTANKYGLDLRKAYGPFYIALESNEIAIIHLEHLYRYITLQVDKLFSTLDDLNLEVINMIGNGVTNQAAYELICDKYGVLNDEWINLVVYFLDFRKILQNDLLGGIFGRRLKPRKPRVGYGTTLEMIATPEVVEKLVKERDDRAGLPPRSEN